MNRTGEPGFEQADRRIEAVPAGASVQVIFFGEVIAESRDAIRLDEPGCEPIYYFPRRDVKMERLFRTTQRTHCPFKGDASYFTLSNGRTSENAAWSYEHPDAPSAIRQRLAFHGNKVDAIRIVREDSGLEGSPSWEIAMLKDRIAPLDPPVTRVEAAGARTERPGTP